MKWNCNRIYGLLLMLVVCLSACNDDDADRTMNYTEKRCRIAVLCPEEWKDNWQEIAAWALENITEGQAGQPVKVVMELDWINEYDPDLSDRMYDIARSGDYSMIIGPTTSSSAYEVAQQVEGRIPMMLPITTSTELQRIYGGHNGMWFFTQSDISQCEILLTQAKLGDYSHVRLITSADEYGKSFSDWFSYQAIELGLAVDDIIVYANRQQLAEAVRRQHGIVKWYDTAILFAPSKEEDALVFDKEVGRIMTESGSSDPLKYPHVLCSDVVNSPKLKGKIGNLRYEGINPSADPRSGWVAAYQGRFGDEPQNGEAQFYDALMLAAFSVFARQEEEPLNNAILRMVDGREGAVCDGWTAPDLQATFTRLATGEEPDLRGVSGDWTWDAKNHNSVLSTFYAHWVYNDGKYTTLEYLTMDGADGSISSTQAWDCQSTYQQSFTDNQKEFDYPELQEQYALIVGASDTWINYRHQADALAFYQLLKTRGYDDDHIILVMEDNIANNPNNPKPGNVRVTSNGENLYHDVKVDYHLSDISEQDFVAILSGQKSNRLPNVIAPTMHDNLLIFWCGHGSRNTLMWGSNQFVYGFEMQSIINSLSKEKRFRKLLFVLDACYSGTIGEACEGIPGVLVFTAAHANETSKADMFDNDMHVWLSNGFTRSFCDKITNEPGISLRNLYYDCVRGTKGSHPHIYNADNYGNMIRENMSEFMFVRL